MAGDAIDLVSEGRLERCWSTVQLLHTLPDGSTHVDWMIAADPDGRQRLTTFRAATRIDRLSTDERALLEPIGDHRPEYLDYEGPLSRGRGHVRRLARGRVLRSVRDGRHWRLEIAWDDDDARDDARQSLTVTFSEAGDRAEVAVLPLTAVRA